MCRDVGYNFTKMPNLMNHTRQAEATYELAQYYPLVRYSCASSLKAFLCSVYTPKCEADGTVRKPCRPLCQKARKGCEKVLKEFAISWPKQLRCNRFPKPSEEACLSENGTVKSVGFPVHDNGGSREVKNNIKKVCTPMPTHIDVHIYTCTYTYIYANTHTHENAHTHESTHGDTCIHTSIS